MNEIDLNLAARSDGPVLITARPTDALAIARLIAAVGRGACPVEVVTCDHAEGDDVLAAMADARLSPPSECERPILLLREVHALTSSEQATVMTRLAERQLRPFEQTARILASSSIDLFDCVERGTFDEQLFYRLNRIHIVGRGPV